MSDYNKSDSPFDKRTILAIVLMVLVVTIGMTVQRVFFPKEPVVETTALETQRPQEQAPVLQAESSPALSESGAQPASQVADTAASIDAPAREELSVIETDILKATFTNSGGQLVSLVLKDHKDQGQPVEMLIAGNKDTEGFALAFGGPGSPAYTGLMNSTRPDSSSIEFYSTFMGKDPFGNDAPYTLRKRFEFRQGEYMLHLTINIENSISSATRMGDGNYAYSLIYGPQIGPSYSHLPKNADWRKVIVREGEKRKAINTKGGTLSFNHRLSWAALAGKYFALITIPDGTEYSYTYTNTNIGGIAESTAMTISRPPIQASSQTDSFYIYIGPKSPKELARYDDPLKNSFKRVNTRLEDVLEGSNILGWLETILKWVMNLFYALVKNWGVAIIMLTLLVRLIMFPLTFKGSMSTARMSELQPKMKEIQEKYKNNPQKMNAEMAEFYKREGYNPLSGCLPMLIQLPIFFAMYALFNNHFDLRGASFIPGWINDLSLAESILDFPTINLLIWRISAIRLLPIIYVVSQLLYGKFMQTPQAGGQSQGQMKFMMYGMPIIFFFVLYDMPAGLLVYWISSNLLTIVQQIVINKTIKAKRAEQAANAVPQKIVPPKGKKSIKNMR